MAFVEGGAQRPSRSCFVLILELLHRFCLCAGTTQWNNETWSEPDRKLVCQGWKLSTFLEGVPTRTHSSLTCSSFHSFLLLLLLEQLLIWPERWVCCRQHHRFLPTKVAVGLTTSFSFLSNPEMKASLFSSSPLSICWDDGFAGRECHVIWGGVDLYFNSRWCSCDHFPQRLLEKRCGAKCPRPSCRGDVSCLPLRMVFPAPGARRHTHGELTVIPPVLEQRDGAWHHHHTHSWGE